MSEQRKMMNVREEFEAISNWLGFQDEDLSIGLKSLKDGIKLWNYYLKHDDIEEYADEWSSDLRIKILGYDPLS